MYQMHWCILDIEDTSIDTEKPPITIFYSSSFHVYARLSLSIESWRSSYVDRTFFRGPEQFVVFSGSASYWLQCFTDINCMHINYVFSCV
jgi:hypothetical protein